MKRALAVLITLLLSPAVRAAGDPSFLPPDGFAGGWNRHEATRTYRGAELYGHIDGGAELFLEFGFEDLTLQRYRQGEDEFVVEVYRMGDPSAALGIYLMKCGRETPAAGFPERHTAGRYQLDFVKGSQYVLVTNVRGTAELQPALLEFGKFVAAALPPSSGEALPDLLPREGRVEGTLRILRGPYALQKVAGSLGDGDLLQLEGKITAVACDYRQPGDAVSTRLVAEYPTEASARAALGHLLLRLDPRIKVLGAGEDRLVFGDPAGKFGEAAVTGRRLEVQFDLPSKPPLPPGTPGSGGSSP